jgi:hypothetical protein
MTIETLYPHEWAIQKTKEFFPLFVDLVFAVLVVCILVITTPYIAATISNQPPLYSWEHGIEMTKMIILILVLVAFGILSFYIRSYKVSKL